MAESIVLNIGNKKRPESLEKNLYKVNSPYDLTTDIVTQSLDALRSLTGYDYRTNPTLNIIERLVDEGSGSQLTSIGAERILVEFQRRAITRNLDQLIPTPTDLIPNFKKFFKDTEYRRSDGYITDPLKNPFNSLATSLLENTIGYIDNESYLKKVYKATLNKTLYPNVTTSDVNYYHSGDMIKEKILQLNQESVFSTYNVKNTNKIEFASQSLVFRNTYAEDFIDENPDNNGGLYFFNGTAYNETYTKSYFKNYPIQDGELLKDYILEKQDLETSQGFGRLSIPNTRETSKLIGVSFQNDTPINLERVYSLDKDINENENRFVEVRDGDNFNYLSYGNDENFGPGGQYELKKKFGVRRGLVHYTTKLAEDKNSTIARDVKTLYNKDDGDSQAIYWKGNGECRTFTVFDQYDNFNRVIKFDGNNEKNSVINYSVLPKIAPYDTDTFEDRYKHFFTMENLAVRVDNDDDCDLGPNGGRWMWFVPYNVKIQDNNNVNWSEINFLGRPEPIYSYQNSKRSLSLSFSLLIDTVSDIQKVKPTIQNYYNYLYACGDIEYNDYVGTTTNVVPGTQQTTQQQTPVEYGNKLELFFKNDEYIVIEERDAADTTVSSFTGNTNILTAITNVNIYTGDTNILTAITNINTITGYTGTTNIFTGASNGTFETNFDNVYTTKAVTGTSLQLSNVTAFTGSKSLHVSGASFPYDVGGNLIEISGITLKPNKQYIISGKMYHDTNIAITGTSGMLFQLKDVDITKCVINTGQSINYTSANTPSTWVTLKSVYNTTSDFTQGQYKAYINSIGLPFELELSGKPYSFFFDNFAVIEQDPTYATVSTAATFNFEIPSITSKISSSTVGSIIESSITETYGGGVSLNIYDSSYNGNFDILSFPSLTIQANKKYIFSGAIYNADTSFPGSGLVYIDLLNPDNTEHEELVNGRNDDKIQAFPLSASTGQWFTLYEEYVTPATITGSTTVKPTVYLDTNGLVAISGNAYDFYFDEFIVIEQDLTTVSSAVTFNFEYPSIISSISTEVTSSTIQRATTITNNGSSGSLQYSGASYSTTGYLGTGAGWDLIFSSITIQPSKKYIISAAMYSDNVTLTGDGAFSVGLRKTDGYTHPELQTNTAITQNYTSASTTDSWIVLNKEYTTPASITGTTTIMPVAYFSSLARTQLTGSPYNIYLDDIAIIEQDLLTSAVTGNTQVFNDYTIFDSCFENEENHTKNDRKLYNAALSGATSGYNQDVLVNKTYTAATDFLNERLKDSKLIEIEVRGYASILYNNKKSIANRKAYNYRLGLKRAYTLFYETLYKADFDVEVDNKKYAADDLDAILGTDTTKGFIDGLQFGKTFKAEGAGLGNNSNCRVIVTFSSQGDNGASGGSTFANRNDEDEVRDRKAELISIKAYPQDPTNTNPNQQPQAVPVINTSTIPDTTCDPDLNLKFTRLEKENKFPIGFQKLNAFTPGFNSQTPFDFTKRYVFLNQLTRPSKISQGARIENIAFGRMPVFILRYGDFLHTKAIANSINFDISDATWDLNPEGMGAIPLMCNVTMDLTLIGGQSLAGPIDKIQTANDSNFIANTTFNTGLYQGNNRFSPARRQESRQYPDRASGRDETPREQVPDVNPSLETYYRNQAAGVDDPNYVRANDRPEQPLFEQVPIGRRTIITDEELNDAIGSGSYRQFQPDEYLPNSQTALDLQIDAMDQLEAEQNAKAYAEGLKPQFEALDAQTLENLNRKKEEKVKKEIENAAKKYNLYIPRFNRQP